MSEVRMCDNCGELFSVNSQGWGEYTQRINSAESNPYNHGLKVMHICAKCGSPDTSVKPRLPLIQNTDKVMNYE